MKKMHNLNKHTIQELAKEVAEFFKREKHMETEILPMDATRYIIRAEKYGKDIYEKVLGDDTACTVELIEVADGVVSVQAGNGKWLGKLVGTATVGAIGLLPACWPVYIAMFASGGAVGINIHKQANLPKEVDRFIYKFLNEEKNPVQA